MKTLLYPDTQSAQGSAVPPHNKVCMHVLGKVVTDPRVMREAIALAEAGFLVSIVDIEDVATKALQEDVSGVHIKHIIIPDWNTSRRLQLLFFIRAVRVFILSILYMLQSDADIYHAHDMKALAACYIAACIRRKPLIFDAHELPPEESSIVFWQRLNALLKHFLSWIVPRCAGVITVSLPIAKEIHQLYRGPEVTLIRNFPLYKPPMRSDRLRKHLGLSSDVRIALYQGGVQPNRGLDKLVYSAPFLADNIVIVLMGKAMEATLVELNEIIEREGVANRVKILPARSYEELLDWTASADIGLNILPVDYSLSIKWCLPNKLFEYLMVGLPVLTSELDAVIEVVETYDVGRVLPSLAPLDVATAINGLLADSNVLEQMRKNALHAAEYEFSWEKERVHLIDLYKDILTRWHEK